MLNYLFLVVVNISQHIKNKWRKCKKECKSAYNGFNFVISHLYTPLKKSYCLIIALVLMLLQPFGNCAVYATMVTPEGITVPTPTKVNFDYDSFRVDAYRSALNNSGLFSQNVDAYSLAGALQTAYKSAGFVAENGKYGEDYKQTVQYIKETNGLPDSLKSLDASLFFVTLDYADMTIGYYVDQAGKKVGNATVKYKDKFAEVCQGVYDSMQRAGENAYELLSPKTDAFGNSSSFSLILDSKQIFAFKGSLNSGRTNVALKYSLEPISAPFEYMAFTDTTGYNHFFIYNSNLIPQGKTYKDYGINSSVVRKYFSWASDLKYFSVADLDLSNEQIHHDVGMLYRGWCIIAGNYFIGANVSNEEFYYGTKFSPCTIGSTPITKDLYSYIDKYLGDAPKTDIPSYKQSKVTFNKATTPACTADNATYTAPKGDTFSEDKINDYINNCDTVVPGTDGAVSIPWDYPDVIRFPAWDEDENPAVVPGDVVYPDTIPGTDNPDIPGTDIPGTDNPDIPGTDIPGTDNPDIPGTDIPGTDNPDIPGIDNPSKADTDNPSKADTDNPSKADTDNPTETDLDVPSAIGKLELLDRFPFCVPSDLIQGFKLFNATPTTPTWSWKLSVNGTPIQYTWVVSLDKFEKIAQLCRTLLTILFVWGLAKVTRYVIKG